MRTYCSKLLFLLFIIVLKNCHLKRVNYLRILATLHKNQYVLCCPKFIFYNVL